MNPHRKGNAFINKQVPGDPRLLDQLQRQQVRTMGTITHTHSGTLINPTKQPRVIVPAHPWKVTASTEGEDYLYVSPGVCFGWIPRDNASGNSTSASEKFFAPFVGDYRKFAGADIEITDSGIIFGKFDMTRKVEGIEYGEEFDIGAGLHRPDEAVTLFFFDLTPSDLAPNSDDMDGAKDIYFPIAEVTLEDGVASLDFQLMKENLWVSLDDIEHDFRPPE